MSSDRGFAAEAWERTTTLRAAIDGSEFLRQLGAGTLAPQTFRHYLEQDAQYLAGYGRALALLAARAPDVEAAGFWAGAAQGASVVEASLHGDLLGSEELPPGESPAGESVEASPTTLGYVSYLVATAATAPYAVAAAAVLPCFWIYADVAARLAASARVVTERGSGHPYARWIATYDAAEFAASVERAKGFVDAAAEQVDTATREAMHVAFGVATRYEFMFWETTLGPEVWPLTLS